MDNAGNAIVVWAQSDGTTKQIYKSEYRFDGSAWKWTNPTNLTLHHISPDGWIACNPHVAMDNNGNAIIVWQQANVADTAAYIFKSEYRFDGSVWKWTNPGSTSDHISQGVYATNALVRMDDKGNAIIAWRQYENKQIYMVEYRGSPKTWSTTPMQISKTGSNASMPQIAMSYNEEAIIVWNQSSDGSWDHNRIYKSEYRSNTWTNPLDLTDYFYKKADYGAFDPQVAMDSNGNTIITWRQYDGTNYNILKSQYHTGSGWVHPSQTPVALDSVAPTGSPAAPKVGMDDSGNGYIVWYQWDGTNYSIFKSEYHGASWTSPGGITEHISPASLDCSEPQIGVSNDGYLTITWDAGGKIFTSNFR
jgi:hypothetical protein